jgi:hypothetical protein
MNTLLPIALCMVTAAADNRPSLLIVVGAAGSPEYAAQFHQWAEQWKQTAKKGDAEVTMIGATKEEGASDLDRLRAFLGQKASDGGKPLWIVLIGHGTYDGREAKFNLRGPDVTDIQLSEWLTPIKRPVAVLDCTSASAPFLNRLSGPNRVIITATRSGSELNYARLGEYLAGAIADPSADLDKDGQVSLLEAFLTASKRVAEYYRTHSQLATEHALLDDNGDRLGTPAEWFRGVHATRRAKDGAPLDGIRAHQFHLIPSDRERGMSDADRQRRDQLEQSLAALRDQKSKLGEEEYYKQIEPLMVELARIYSKLQPAPSSKTFRGN